VNDSLGFLFFSISTFEDKNSEFLEENRGVPRYVIKYESGTIVIKVNAC